MADQASKAGTAEAADERDPNGAPWRTPASLDVLLPPDPASLDPGELQLIGDNLPILCWVARGDGYIFWYNKRWHDYCGSTPESMAGWGWQSVHDPAVLPQVMERWTASIASGEAFEMVFPLRGADGVLRPFLTRAVPLRDASGTIMRWFGTNADVSSQVETEKALASSEAYVRLLLDSSAEAFYAVDREGRTTLCNPAFLALMGFEHEDEVLGRRLHNIIHHSHPDGSHYPAPECPIYQSAANGSSGHVDTEYFYHVDGHAIPVEYWARPIVIDGEHRGAVCTFFDISARRAAEAAERASADALRALNADLERQVVERSTERGTTWQVSPHLLSVIDMADGRFVRVNPAWKKVLGYSEADMTGAPFTDFVAPDDMDSTMAAWAALGAGKPLIDFENRYRDKQGRLRTLAWVCVPEGKSIYSTARDVTEEKERAALVELRTAERDRLWEASEDLLVVADYEGKLLRTSPSWTRLFGYSEEELLAGTYNEIIHPDDLGTVLSALEEMKATGKVARFEDRVRTRDGEWRTIAWTLSPDATRTQLTGVGRDITDQRAIEERLRQSQKMEAVGQLTGGLAHDFNNLLAGISGSLEIITMRLAQGRQDAVDRYLVAAQGAVRRAAALTHRLLAFSRRQTLDPRPTDVNRLVGEMEELVRRTVGPEVTVEVVGAIGLWPTLVDPNQLENALLNLCINARDAMPDGGRLTIETANKWLDDRAARDREIPPGQYISLCVTDTGTGMTPEVAAKAFDPFFTTKPIGEGTGLGLSMIYGFARQTGGQVRIYSEVGQGTTMCLYLPRHEGAGAAASAEDGAAGEERQAGDGEVVLVIDDEPTIRMLITEVLEEAGYRTIEAGDGPSGLKLLQSDARIDLLITDVGLPGGLNGRQVADAARVARPGLKIMFITGYAENAVVGNGQLEAGMAVLTKPFAIDDLSRRIREMIEG